MFTESNTEPASVASDIIRKLLSTLDIPVYMFASKYTNAGKLNPAYENIEQVMTSYVSIAAAGGKAGADKVRITNGNIRMNEYWNQQGQFVSFPRVNASFIST